MPTITLDQWQQALTLLTPLIVSLVLQAHWRAQIKRAIAIAMAVVMAVVPEVLQHKLNATTIVPEALAMIVASQGFYYVLKTKFDLITGATTKSPTPDPQPVRPPGA